MEKEINIVELLKDCPPGMELDCTMFENVTFEGIKQDEYPIIVKIKEPSISLSLTKTGCWNLYNSAKCVIFPKGKTTWEGFVPPCDEFKNGDVIYTDGFIAILSHITEKGSVWYHCFYCIDTKTFKAKHDFGIGNIDRDEFRLATKEEKAKLFKTIKYNGYAWNEETKILEKLIEPEPKFKVGDRIRYKVDPKFVFTITSITKDKYECGKTFVLRFTNQDEYELVPNKFDITTLKPFESKVLVRDINTDKWIGAFYSHCKSNGKKFYTIGSSYYYQCIPYEGNEHLLDTTDDCDEYFKIWE